MTKTRLVLLMMFVLAMGAGVAVGMLGSQTLPQRDGFDRKRLIQELELSAEQEQQMRGIWSEMLTTKGREYGEQFRSLHKQRDMDIAALLKEDQIAQFQHIEERFARNVQELWKRCEQDFQAAVDRTKQILNPSQREKFDAIVSKFQAQRGNDWMGGSPMGRGGPATAPSQAQ